MKCQLSPTIAAVRLIIFYPSHWPLACLSPHALCLLACRSPFSLALYFCRLLGREDERRWKVRKVIKVLSAIASATRLKAKAGKLCK